MTTRTHLIYCIFDGETLADEARMAIEALDARLDTVKLGNIAMLSKSAAGTIEYWETEEVAAQARSTTFGIVVGWLVGMAGLLVGSPAGPVQAGLAGQLTGASEPLNRDHGFPDEELRHLAESLHAGSSLLVTLVQPAEAPVVIAELERLGGRLAQQTLHPDVLQRLTASAQ